MRVNLRTTTTYVCMKLVCSNTQGNCTKKLSIVSLGYCIIVSGDIFVSVSRLFVSDLLAEDER